MIRVDFNKVTTIVLEQKDKDFMDCMCGIAAQFIICDFEKTEEIDKYLKSYVTDGNMETGKIIYLR